MASVSSVPIYVPEQKNSNMKNHEHKAPDDDLLPEYNLTALGQPVRGKYLARLQDGTNLARLDPDVAKAFPTDEAVNTALRSLLKTTPVS